MAEMKRTTSLGVLQSSLVLKDAEILLKETELNEKRYQLQQSQTTIEELREALRSGCANERELRSKIDKLKATAHRQWRDNSERLDAIEQRLRESEVAKKQLESDLSKKASEKRRDIEKIATLEATIDVSDRRIRTLEASVDRWSSAFNKKDSALAACHNKIDQMKKEKSSDSAAYELLQSRCKKAKQAENDAVLALYNEVTENRRKLEENSKDFEQRLKAQRILLIEERLKSEEELKQQHDLEIQSLTYQIQTLRQEKEEHEMQFRRELELKDVKHRLELKEWKDALDQRMDTILQRLESLSDQTQHLDQQRYDLQKKANALEYIGEYQVARERQAEEEHERKQSVLHEMLQNERRKTQALRRKLQLWC